MCEDFTFQTFLQSDGKWLLEVINEHSYSYARDKKECWYLCKSTENCNWFTFDKDPTSYGEYLLKNYGICWMYSNCPRNFYLDWWQVTGHKDCKHDAIIQSE